MKQLISLLLIILVTVVSWSSCAKNKVNNMETLFSLAYPVASSLLLAPTLTSPETTDNLSFHQAKVVSGHNRFFELSIVFNENLQQVMALFTRSNDEKSDVANNIIPSNSNNQSIVKACKENS